MDIEQAKELADNFRRLVDLNTAINNTAAGTIHNKTYGIAVDIILDHQIELLEKSYDT